MHTAQEGYVEAARELQELYRTMQQEVRGVSGDLDEIKGLLGEGFRLPAPGERT